VSQQGASSHFATYASGPWPVFFVDSSGYAVAQHATDYRPVTPSDPAKPGEWIAVYATNLGPVQNQPLDGYPAPTDVLAPIVSDPSPYLYYYIGMAPGSILYQVNLLVPSSQATGDLVFQVLKIYNCGFFFVLGCGRSFTTEAASMASKIPLAR
jgi:uncharacterized protein (TIGR03437 family)